jgi:hypothetical protein
MRGRREYLLSGGQLGSKVLLRALRKAAVGALVI